MSSLFCLCKSHFYCFLVVVVVVVVVVFFVLFCSLFPSSCCCRSSCCVLFICFRLCSCLCSCFACANAHQPPQRSRHYTQRRNLRCEIKLILRCRMWKRLLVILHLMRMAKDEENERRLMWVSEEAKFSSQDLIRGFWGFKLVEWMNFSRHSVILRTIGSWRANVDQEWKVILWVVGKSHASVLFPRAKPKSRPQKA